MNDRSKIRPLPDTKVGKVGTAQNRVNAIVLFPSRSPKTSIYARSGQLGLINEITTALKTGLDNAINDPQLKKNGGADFSDRPISKGEKILEAVDEFENEQTQSTLDHLKSAVYSTNLNYRVQTIEKLLGRTRSYQNQSPAVAMHGEIYRLRNEAEIYYSMKAH